MVINKYININSPMEEAVVNYFTQLITHSTTNTIVLLAISVIEGDDKLLTDDIIFRINMLLLTDSNNELNSVTTYDNEDLYYLLMEVLFVFRPLRTKYASYYNDVVLKDKMKTHFSYLLVFLIGNIFLGLLNFVIIKLVVFDKIDFININFDKLTKILKCT